MMITFGILVVAIRLYMYISIATDKIVLYVGSFGGIIVDFIGAIFIKIYTKTVKFHAKFAESNNLLLANSIAYKMDNDKIREETLSVISPDIILAKRESDE